MSKFLTVGMATHSDYHGVYFTIQSLRLHHDVSEIEIVIVDNAPNTRDGELVRNLVKNKGMTDIKYYPYEESQGTTQTRQHIFDKAEGEFVLCTDCHVLFHAGSIANLIRFYKRNRDTNNLYSGTMWYDSLVDYSTHFDLTWRGEMWGIWSKAWKSKDGDDLICVRDGDKGIATFHDLITGERLKRLPTSRDHIPQCNYVGHESVMLDKGFYPIGKEETDEPFPIPAMGLGSFTCRKDAWLGFNPHMRSFGGEEGYIHEKFRQAGFHSVCLPFLRWTHRFGRPDGIRYPLTRQDKVRNYVLGFQELGLPLDSIYEHFISTGLLPESVWQELIKDPVNFNVSRPKPPKEGELRFPTNHTFKSNQLPVVKELKNSRGLPMPPSANIITLEGIYSWLHQGSGKRDLDVHLPKMRELVSTCKDQDGSCHVTEFTKRRESSFGFLVAKPDYQTSYIEPNESKDTLLQLGHYVLSKEKGNTTWSTTDADPMNIDAVEETDILFIDSLHNEDRVYGELTKHGHKVSRYICFHDTYIYGKQGDNGKRGLSFGIMRWMNDRLDKGEPWFVCYHTNDQYGFTVISKDPRDKPDERLVPWSPGFGVGSSVKKFLKNRLGIVATENCKCNKRADLMDMKGADWCKSNLDTIIMWMREEYDKRVDLHRKDPDNHPKMSVPFIRTAVSLWLTLTIRRVKKMEGVHGERWVVTEPAGEEG